MASCIRQHQRQQLSTLPVVGRLRHPRPEASLPGSKGSAGLLAGCRVDLLAGCRVDLPVHAALYTNGKNTLTQRPVGLLPSKIFQNSTKPLSRTTWK